jgi:hypothetical protein
MCSSKNHARKRLYVTVLKIVPVLARHFFVKKRIAFRSNVRTANEAVHQLRAVSTSREYSIEMKVATSAQGSQEYRVKI